MKLKENLGKKDTELTFLREKLENETHKRITNESEYNEKLAKKDIEIERLEKIAKNNKDKY